MTEADGHPGASAATARARGLSALKERSRLPSTSWKLLSVAVLSMLAGLVWWIADGQPKSVAETNDPATRSAISAASGLVGQPTSSNATEPAEPASGSSSAPLAFRMGFSFFMGFAVAFALRSVVKVAITVIGFAFLAAFGLHYSGLIDVSWDAVAGQFDSMQDWLLGQVESVRAFAKGVLPSATATTVGLFAGWRRKSVD